MKYIVRVLNPRAKTLDDQWKDDSEYDRYQDARARAVELVGVADPHTEPSLDLEEAFFGTKNQEDPWTCMIKTRKDPK